MNTEQCALFNADVYKTQEIENQKTSLCDKFLIPPFSTLDTRQGYWQNRKKMWQALGIKSELGRDATTFNMKDWADKKALEGNLSGNSLPSDTSIFDPVLCEIMYKWFCPNDGKILDPFAGGSVRGIVANTLGYQYVGIDLSEKQIEANYVNAKELLCDFNKLKWINDDSLNVNNYIEDDSVDMIFTCPPYFDLEVYSDKPNDISNMKFEDFKFTYQAILRKAFSKLKNNRFGIIVIGDVRDKNGFYRNLVDITKQAIVNEEIGFYNDIILLNSLASASLRAESQFSASRKVVKVHQNVLVFYKGNQKEIRNNYRIY